MKKIRPILLFLLANLTYNPIWADQIPKSNTSVTTDLSSRYKNLHPVIPEVLLGRIKDNIKTVYGESQVIYVYPKVVDIIRNTKRARGLNLREIDISEPITWYQNQITYMFYADNFGLVNRGIPNNFRDTAKMIPYLKELGITNVYILPFLDSPMKDSGFDVKDPNKIRPELGTLADFRNFVTQLHKKGIRITTDLVLNHLSDQNAWYQQALQGDMDKVNYFVHKDYLPIESKYQDPIKGVLMKYQNRDGSITTRRLIFPELSDSHYRKEVINGKNFYFYHTFYPSQIDLNWKNPKVLDEMLKIIGFWCNQGIDIFRLDAIPFLIKDDGTMGENDPKTHAIVNIISSFIQASCPNTVLQAEAGQSPKAILPYFGKEQSYTYTDLNQSIDMVRTEEVQIAYNFPLMPALWASMIFSDNTYFWKTFQSLPTLPSTANWANFLRVHDELTLETADPGIRNALHDKLIKNGSDFRKGIGVSGRMANFLDKDYRRINQAFAILLSLPDSPVIYYGDDIGALNNWEFARQKAKARQKAAQKKNPSISFFDSRDINRGPITLRSFENAQKNPQSYGGRIYYPLKHDIMLRRENPPLSSNKVVKVDTDQPQVLAYLRGQYPDSILVINNLSPLPVTTKIKINNYQPRTKSTYIDLRSNKYYYLNFNKAQAYILLLPYQTLWLKNSYSSGAQWESLYSR